MTAGALCTGALWGDFFFSILARMKCKFYLALGPMQLLRSIDEMIIGEGKLLQCESMKVGVGDWVSCGKAPYIFRKCIILHYHVTTIIPGELFPLRNGPGHWEWKKCTIEDEETYFEPKMRHICK